MLQGTAARTISKNAYNGMAKVYRQLASSAAGMTHEVTNQAEPLECNAYLGDVALVEATERHSAGGFRRVMEAYGDVVGSAEWQEKAAMAHAHPPKLKTFDRYGRRIDAAEYHPAYHEIIGNALAHGVAAHAWNNETKPGAHVARAALMYMHYQLESGSSCPLTMTFASVPALRHTPSVADVWVPRVTANAYDRRDVPASEKKGCTIGMSMTEKQGGSDVRTNTTTATPIAGGAAGEYSLVGHKWFTSAPMSDAFLTLAKTSDASPPSCFLVPRWMPDGAKNVGFQVQRLKDKLGDKSNASSEVEYRNAYGQMVGEEGHGVRTIIDMVTHTRLDCALGSAALMRQGVALAINHTSGRAAFGKRLVEQPLMQSVLADLVVEAEAATALTFRLASALDNPGDAQERAFSRIAMAVGKYYVCKRAPQHVFEAMESHGGNGYVEEYLPARMFRQSPLNSIWEGSGNVICLDVLRAMATEPAAIQAFMAELQPAQAKSPVLKGAVDRLSRDLAAVAKADAAVAQASARRLVERMAVALQAALLVEAEAADGLVADAFLAARLADGSGSLYGALPAAVTPAQAQALIARAHPRR